jgi:hypothetical protein
MVYSNLTRSDGKFSASLFLILFFCSCKTYYIPVDSFKQQFAGMQQLQMKEVTVQGPASERTTYKTFPQDSVDCFNKNGNRIRLEKIPSLEIRFTDTNNKRTVFYFDRIFVTDTYITGTYSRILGLKKSISLNSIKKVELQDGRKNYRYVHN